MTNVVYEDNIPFEDQDRMNVFFRRWELYNQERWPDSDKKYYVQRQPYKFKLTYTIYEMYKSQELYNSIYRVSRKPVYVRARIKVDDFGLLMAHGVKSMGPCDGTGYRFKGSGPVHEDFFTKHFPEESKRQLESWDQINYQNEDDYQDDAN